MQSTPPTGRPTTPRLDAVLATHRVVAYRPALVDLAGDVVAGVFLSQVLYWMPRTTVHRDGRSWIVKAPRDWWEECRLTEDQARRATKALRDRGLIETRVWKWNGTPTTHLTLIEEALEEALATLDPTRDDPEWTRATAQVDLGDNPSGPGTRPKSSVTPEMKTEMKTEIVVSDDVRRLADLLAELMVANGCRPPSITKTGFLDPIRLLIEKDGVEPDRVERAIRWSQADEFWRANIHSGKALREKYDTLRQQARRQKAGSVAQVADARAEYLARKQAG